MKSNLTIIAVAAVVGSLTFAASGATPANTQNIGNTGQNNNTGQAPGWGYGRMFNSQTVETITGQVTQVETTTHGTRHGVELQVKTESGNLPVFLGPSWFIDNQETHIRPNEQIEVTGSRITVNSQPALVASEVRTDGQVLQLRNQYGRPLWAAWGPSNQSGRTSGQTTNRGMMGQGMGPGMMGHGMMGEQYQTTSRLREMQADVDKKVEQMNQASGQQKIDDMASVISALVRQRQELINDLANRRAQMWERMQHHRQQMQGMMGGSGTSTGSPNPSSEGQAQK